MTVRVELTDEREAATAASRVSEAFTAPGWEPTPVPEGTEGWLSFSHWAGATRSRPNLSSAYAHMAEQGACPIEAGLIGALADNECEHERLPTDPTPPCGCWPSEVVKDPARVADPGQTKPEIPVATLPIERRSRPPSVLEVLAIAEIAAAKPAIAVPALADLELPSLELKPEPEVAVAEPETPVATLALAELDELPEFLRGMVERIDAELERLRGERTKVAAVREALR